MEQPEHERKRRGALTQAIFWPRHASLSHFAMPWAQIAQSWQIERDERRLFLWLPVCSGAGVLLYLAADSEPVLWLPLLLLLAFSALSYATRHSAIAFCVALMLAATTLGFISAELRTARMAAPVLDRIRIARLSGTIDEVDLRRDGARFVLHVHSASQTNGVPLPESITPTYVRLSMRKSFVLETGQSITLTTRLLPPAHASLPGGYDFARTAFFSRIGAVGSVLGAVQVAPDAHSEGLLARAMQALDRGRNRLAQRVDTIIGGDEGAVAAAMVAGKRSLLSENAQEIIREAGIFHIITISGVQMTLVAGMVFWISRWLLAFFSGLSLHYPTKKIAAMIAIAAAIFYDIATGSRVGTERALFMTLIVLSAVLFDRRALTMRNLALAAFAVILLEPEAITGASFQLSFAAVAALIAVQEARYAKAQQEKSGPIPVPPAVSLHYLSYCLARIAHHAGSLMVSTLCATAATASFMASDFHDLSPYVLVGNPLTLVIIEFFAVPGALLGTLLYPLGLDAPVWLYVGLGIKLVFWMARIIGSAPGSTVHLHAFAPWTLPFLSLGVLNMVIWRSWVTRALALPCFTIGALGISIGAPFDIAIPPTGDFFAWRNEQGNLEVGGRHPGTFAAAQWLSADADGRQPAEAKSHAQNCDRTGCVAHLPDGRTIALVSTPQSFEEDCARADIIISSWQAPQSCQSALIFDRTRLAALGAVTMRYADTNLTSERQPYTDRPWSQKPQPQKLGSTQKNAKRDSKKLKSENPDQVSDENTTGNGKQNPLGWNQAPNKTPMTTKAQNAEPAVSQGPSKNPAPRQRATQQPLQSGPDDDQLEQLEMDIDASDP